jgi:EpsI family protein
VLENLGATDTLICNYARADRASAINLYIGYHATQIREEGGGSAENSIHPPNHCLPGSGWDIIDNRMVEIDMPGLSERPATVKRLVIARGNHRQLTYYWYQGRGHVTAQDWEKILRVGLDRALSGRTDGALIRFTVPILNQDERSAEASFRDLAPQILALIPAYVPD